jgi:uncharacterized protein YhbP (UPF0306 family)
MNIEKTIREYLPQVIHLSLATSIENKPWVSELHFVYDDELSLYFRSTPQRRHSQEIAINPNVAGNIIVQHQLGQKVRGVYFEGTAALLNDVTEDHVAYLECVKRFGMGKEILESATQADGHKFYQITVETFYLFDSVESSPSQKYELPWKR